jgi:hypothetical protein
MLKRVTLSFVLILAILALSFLSVPEGKPSTQVTGTAFDTAPPPEAACQASIEAALQQQWQSLGDDLLAAIRSCPAFTAEDRKKLRETEKKRTAREIYFIRRVVLTKLAQRPKA